MAAADVSLLAALFQQPADPRKRGQRPISEVIDIAGGKTGRGTERLGIALDDRGD